MVSLTVLLLSINFVHKLSLYHIGLMSMQEMGHEPWQQPQFADEELKKKLDAIDFKPGDHDCELRFREVLTEIQGMPESQERYSMLSGAHLYVAHTYSLMGVKGDKATEDLKAARKVIELGEARYDLASRRQQLEYLENQIGYGLES